MKRLVSEQRRSIVNLKRLLQVDRWLYPPVCLLCGLAGRRGLDLCSGCETDLELLDTGCRRCGLELERTVELCGRCTTRLPNFTAAWPGYAYRGQLERLIQRFKFHGDLAAGRVLAGLFAGRLASMAAPRPDLMVPVPLHPRRRLRRGFNQAALLARDLGAHLGGLPWMEVLVRKRSTRAQSELPADRRRGNVRGAFEIGRLPPGVRFVALVDDVMTTGSTLDECARVLLRAGVERVDVWVVARA
ncbi:MAG: ComF family protein [Wenzhouxiangella sp.]|nr:ComF family protein [Wenzhouxiangella sp.]